MRQKINRINKNWFWWWKNDKDGILKDLKKLKIEKYYEVLKHENFTFILHKPQPNENWNRFLITEIRTGAAAAKGESHKEVMEAWEKFKAKSQKKDILINIARATKEIKRLEKEWERIQSQS